MKKIFYSDIRRPEPSCQSKWVDTYTENIYVKLKHNARLFSLKQWSNEKRFSSSL